MILLSGRKKEAVEDSSVGLSHAADSDGDPIVHGAGGEATAAVTVTQGCTSESLKLVTLWSFQLRHPGL